MILIVLLKSFEQIFDFLVKLLLKEEMRTLSILIYVYCNQTVQIVIIYYIISLIKHFLLVDNKLSIE